MPETRLDFIDPNLLTRLQTTNKLALRRIALRTCQCALQQIGLVHLLLDQALRELEANPTPPVYLSSALDQLVEGLEEIYFDLLDAAEMGRAEGKGWKAAFCKARAAHAVYFAVGEDAYLAACEAIYEANAATKDLDTLPTDCDGNITRLGSGTLSVK